MELCGGEAVRTNDLLYANLGEKKMQRFTAYRRDMNERETHNEMQKNDESEPQYEGVVWSDGTVTIRWLTPLRSHSVWASIGDMLGVHGHPEYGTEIVWHDGEPPTEWIKQLESI